MQRRAPGGLSSVVVVVGPRERFVSFRRHPVSRATAAITHPLRNGLRGPRPWDVALSATDPCRHPCRHDGKTKWLHKTMYIHRIRDRDSRNS